MIDWVSWTTGLIPGILVSLQYTSICCVLSRVQCLRSVGPFGPNHPMFIHVVVNLILKEWSLPDSFLTLLMTQFQSSSSHSLMCPIRFCDVVLPSFTLWIRRLLPVSLRDMYRSIKYSCTTSSAGLLHLPVLDLTLIVFVWSGCSYSLLVPLFWLDLVLVLSSNVVQSSRIPSISSSLPKMIPVSRSSTSHLGLSFSTFDMLRCTSLVFSLWVISW